MLYQRQLHCKKVKNNLTHLLKNDIILLVRFVRKPLAPEEG